MQRPENHRNQSGGGGIQRASGLVETPKQVQQGSHTMTMTSTQTSAQRFRLVIKLWLFASLAGIVWNLIPVFAKYSADQQKLAELEEQRRRPPVATVDVAEDSPWPGTTIQMMGQPVGGLDDANLPSAGIRFGQRHRMAVTHRRVSVIELNPNGADVVHSFPDDTPTENLDVAAISGDGKVIATVGEFTQVSFWNATTGELLQTLDDDFPTVAAHPDRSERRDKHSSGLRYSNTGARLLVAAPGGCLFAIGKMDGTVELWTAEGQPLPDRPAGLVTPKWPYQPEDKNPPPTRFHRLRRMSLHEGEVRQIEFSLDCQSLVSTSGHRVVQMQEQPIGEGIPSYWRPIYDDSTTPAVVKTEVATGKNQWKVNLPALPVSMAINPHSQHVPGLIHPAQVALALGDHNVTVLSLDEGRVLNTFSNRYGRSTIHTSAMAFGEGSSLLWTVGTRSRGDAVHRSVTSVSAWDVVRGQRIATAEVPGQVMSAGWNTYGTLLATVRYFDDLPAGQQHVPWAFHIWDMKIVRQKPSHGRVR